MNWHALFDEQPHGRRHTDRHGWRRFVRANAYRDLWLLIITGVALLGIWLAVGGSDKAERTSHAVQIEIRATNAAAATARIAAIQAARALARVQQGRSDAVRITCAVLTGISQAGRDTIVGPASAPETPFTRQLEKIGYPPRAVRIRQAKSAADAYVQGINRDVIHAVGAEKARGVVLPGGQINCQRLLSISKAH